MAVKLVVSDIDGTLVGKDEVLSSAIDELDDLLRRYRIKFTLASGRTAPMMAEFTKRLHITLPTVVCNGSGAYRQGQFIWNDFLNSMEMKPAIDFADSLDLAIIISNGDCEAAYRRNAYIQRHIDKFGKWNNIYHPSEAEFSAAKIQKLLIIDPLYPGRIDSVIEKLDVATGSFSIVRYDARGIEIMSSGSSKGSAIRRLAGYLGVDLRDVLAIGNEINDIDMLKNAGIGAAVANSADELKQCADYVCVNEDIYGVIEAVRRFCLP